MVNKWYEKNVTVGMETITVRTFRCPTHHVVLFRVPEKIPVPTEKIEINCPLGDKVMVPKYEDSQKI